MIKKMMMILICVLVVNISFVSAQQTDVQGLRNFSNTFVNVCKEVTPAVVHIMISQKVKPQENSLQEFFGDEFFRRFFQDRLPKEKQQQRPNEKQEYRTTGTGSGFLIDSTGHIISNNHVVKDADEIKVILSDRREFIAKVVGTDEKTDVAVIKIEGENFPYVKLGNSDKISVGEWVIAVGNPFGLNQTVTAGIISAKGRANMGLADYEDFIQTDAAINPGNSGGPLVNLNGEVIGMNTAIFSRTGGSLGIGFAVPSNMIRSIKDQLLTTGKVTRGWLGVTIQDITPEMAQGFGFSQSKGCVVVQVAENGPADKAGLKQGDIISTFGGTPIENSSHLKNLVAVTLVNSSVSLEVYRNNKLVTLTVKIGDLSKANLDEDAEDEDAEEGICEELGVKLQNVTPEIAKKLRMRQVTGVLISEVLNNSYLKRYEGNVIIQVNRKEVKTVDDVKKAITLNKRKAYIIILTKSGLQYISLPLLK